MGEAKLKARALLAMGQPMQTAKSPFQRGLVLPPPYRSIKGGLQTLPIDIQEVYLGVLYWDKIASPTNNFISVDGPSYDLLESEGILLRPSFQFRGSYFIDSADMFIDAHVASFNELEKQNPGKWAFSQGNRRDLIRNNVVAENTGILVDLVKALPVPLHDTPIEAILKFKDKRRAELLRLRACIEETQEVLLKAENRNDALNKKCQDIELACLDLIKISKEEWKVFNLSDLQTLFGCGAMAGSAEMLLHAQFPAVSALLGAGGSAVKIAKDVGLRRQANRKNPYWYIAKFHSKILK